MVAISICFSALAILNEAVKQLRATLQKEAIVGHRKSSKSCSYRDLEEEPDLSNVIENPLLSQAPPAATNLKKLKIMDGILFAIQMVLSYLVMLVVMSYSIWIFLAVIIGQAIGSWIFFQKPTVLLHQVSSSLSSQRHCQREEEGIEEEAAFRGTDFTESITVADVHHN